MTERQRDILMRSLAGENCYMEYILRRQPTTDSSAGTIAYCAREHWQCAIQCLMVGLEHESHQLLAKSDEWMSLALKRAAAGEVIELEYLQHFRCSVGRWLLGHPAPAFDLTRAYELLADSEEMTLANVGEYADLLDSSLTALVYAERYDECIAKFEQEKTKDPRSKRQKRADAMSAYLAGKIAADEVAAFEQEYPEAALAYLIARERLQPTLAEAEWKKQFELFLRQQLPQWLKYARYDAFVMWIRIITQAEAGAPARAAVRAIADQYA